MINYKKNRGQSLVEVVAAIGIFLMVVSVILALTATNIAGQKTSEFQIIANNLAREGIEVVRNIRDSNWLLGNDWDLGLKGSVLNQNNEAVAVFKDGNWVLDLPNNDSLYLSESGIYSHESDGGTLTVFSRRLTLDNICINDATGEEGITKQLCSDQGKRKIGIKISSEVRWFERGSEKKLVLENLIYDWK